ncbi:uncharacterized protein RCO7_04486 [Rhynchosporium graminicola]|uniref:Uncharacterized protein n=1 Tax=Rhynchosporium graminicola TaxID=2792576 RepID=A0A1E1JWW4_9HELO|nr:uncharacterized protein RCO7_04486 [Rhynchosporium commune]
MTSHLPTSYARDSKDPDMYSEEKGSTMINRPSARRNRPFVAAFAAVGLCYLLWKTVSDPQVFRFPCHGQTGPQVSMVDSVAAISDNAKDLGEKKRVPLEAHIMSKCPDARDCLRDMVLPTMQQVIDKVNFTLSYIGTQVFYLPRFSFPELTCLLTVPPITMEYPVCMGPKSAWETLLSYVLQSYTPIQRYT